MTNQNQIHNIIIHLSFILIIFDFHIISLFSFNVIFLNFSLFISIYISLIIIYIICKISVIFSLIPLIFNTISKITIRILNPQIAFNQLEIGVLAHILKTHVNSTVQHYRLIVYFYHYTAATNVLASS
jgi:hypothetical protein